MEERVFWIKMKMLLFSTHSLPPFTPKPSALPSLSPVSHPKPY